VTESCEGGLTFNIFHVYVCCNATEKIFVTEITKLHYTSPTLHNLLITDLQSHRHPSDVDLWSGGVSERPLPGSMVGPTFACIIATQFSYSRRGDRFWYELGNQPSSFTPGKLHVQPII